MSLTEAQAEKILSTWRIARLEDILGPELSPRSWSNNLRKHLCMLCRLVNLEQARILLSNEVTARLANRTRNRGIRRDHLSDVDVMRVLDKQEAQIRGRSDVYSEYSPAPAANQAMRRLDRVSETPDYTRPYAPSPDLSADASSYHPSSASSPASTSASTSASFSASTSITTAPSCNPRTGPSLQWSSTALQLLARNAAAGSRSNYYDPGPSTFDDDDRRMSVGPREEDGTPARSSPIHGLPSQTPAWALPRQSRQSQNSHQPQHSRQSQHSHQREHSYQPQFSQQPSSSTGQRHSSPASEIVVQFPETKVDTPVRATNRRETNLMAAPPPRARSPTAARTSGNSVTHARAEESPRPGPIRTTDDPEPNTRAVASPRQRPLPPTSLKTDTSGIRAMTEPPQRTQTTAAATTTASSSSSSWNNLRPESHIPASAPQRPWPGTTSRTNNPPEHRTKPPDPPRRSESSTTPMTDDTEGVTVVERHKRKRESMMADLEGDIEKLGYKVDIQRTTVKLRQHEYAQERRNMETARVKLESLLSGDGVVAQMEQFDGFLAGLDDLVTRYPAVLHAHDDHGANDMGRALASPSQPPEEADMSLQPGMLFDALKRAVRVKMGSAAHQTERLQDTRRVAERELRAAEAAVDETLATLERAKEDVSKLEDDLHFLSNEKERLSDRFGS